MSTLHDKQTLVKCIEPDFMGLLQFLGTCREQSGTGNTSPGKYPVKVDPGGRSRWRKVVPGQGRPWRSFPAKVVPGEGRPFPAKVVPGQGRPWRSFSAKVVPGGGRSFLVKVDPRGRSRPRSSGPRNCSNPILWGWNEMTRLIHVMTEISPTERVF